MPFAAMFSISPESPHYLRNREHELVLPNASFYTGEILGIYNASNCYILVASIMVDISNFLPDNALTIKVKSRERAPKYQSMVVKIGTSKPVPGYPDINVRASEVFKL